MGGSPTPSVLCALAFYFVFLLCLDRLVQIVQAQNGTTPPSEGTLPPSLSLSLCLGDPCLPCMALLTWYFQLFMLVANFRQAYYH
ncbi:hypothetical protein RHGRI_013926 [Rhododendron griersonianum]|uniref:Uncharacterized protein n=1 Tax=Rhododendron griersonianum TaxID=479676 RepID=A0AAV6K7V6_9ERIC|nr:hypothetical protein RHGRI_013926 [Rhododendron griersonianum]